MYYQKELDFLINVFEKCNLTVNLFDPDQSLGLIFGTGISRYINSDIANLSFSQAVGGVDERTFYRMTDLLQCQYIFLKLPNGQVAFVGPYIIEEVSHEWVLEQAERIGMDPQQAEELERYYRNIPVMRENSRIFAVVDAFCDVIWEDGDYSFINIDKTDDPAFSSLSLNTSVLEEHDSQREMELMERRYAFENQFMEAVSRGQTYKADVFLDAFSPRAFEPRLSDALRNCKNYMIIMNTLLRKSAEQGGVHPIYLDKISSHYAKEIEDMKTVKTVPYFMKQMFEDYCKLVNKHNTKNYSPLIKNVIIYIDSDLAEDFSLKSVAELNGVSPSYLSSCFKQETGKTFVDYVNGKRIDMAKHLLKTTKLQVQTVAQHCGFLDMQYFSKVFKKYTGKTPRAYRESKTRK